MECKTGDGTVDGKGNIIGNAIIDSINLFLLDSCSDMRPLNAVMTWD